MKELNFIQTKLVAQKSKYNSFGNYNYRSCEDILAAVKPLLQETGCTLILSDEIKEVGTAYNYRTQEEDKKNNKIYSTDYTGTRIYVEATATLINEGGETISVKALAREELVKKGMDASQITGTASSYARKYALNGLFAIDDTKDADALNTSKEYTEKPKSAVRAASKPAANAACTVAVKPDVKAAEKPAADAAGAVAVKEELSEYEMLQMAKGELAQANTREELVKVVKRFPQLRSNPDFIAAGSVRKQKLGIA
jgi:hypothetical protein